MKIPLKVLLKNLLGVAILAGLGWYLVESRTELARLLELNLKNLVWIYATLVVGNLFRARLAKELLQTLTDKVGFWDMLLLQNAALLLNYLPMKVGTVFRANYVKRKYGLGYARFGAYLVFVTLLMIGASALLGLVIMLAFYGLSRIDHIVLAGAFAVVLIGGASMIFLPFPTPKYPGPLASALRSLLSGRRDMAGHPRVLLRAVGLLAIGFVLAAVRLWLIYGSVGASLHPAGFLILGSLAMVTGLVSITPGGLGVREAVIAAGAAVLDVPAELAVLTAIAERAIVLSWSICVGGPCALWLWRAYPGDFGAVHRTRSVD